jgi:hypothetical protein
VAQARHDERSSNDEPDRQRFTKDSDTAELPRFSALPCVQFSRVRILLNLRSLEGIQWINGPQKTGQPEETMSHLKSLPIACTLTPGDLQARLGLIRTLTAEALLGYARDGLELTLRYAPDAGERVRAMAARS